MIVNLLQHPVKLRVIKDNQHSIVVLPAYPESIVVIPLTSFGIILTNSGEVARIIIDKYSSNIPSVEAGVYYIVNKPLKDKLNRPDLLLLGKRIGALVIELVL